MESIAAVLIKMYGQSLPHAIRDELPSAGHSLEGGDFLQDVDLESRLDLQDPLNGRTYESAS